MPGYGLVAGGFNAIGVGKRVNPMSYYLGTAAQYSVIGTSIANTGVSSTNLNIGAAKGTLNGGAIGVIPGYVSGALINVGGVTHLEDAEATQAILDVQAAYEHFRVYPSTSAISGDFIGRSFFAGVYSTVEAISCSGAFYVDARNDSCSVFVFIIGGSYRCFGGAFSSGAGSTMVGTVLTPGAITVGDSATVKGRCLSFGGVVTLANNVIITS